VEGEWGEYDEALWLRDSPAGDLTPPRGFLFTLNVTCHIWALSRQPYTNL